MKYTRQYFLDLITANKLQTKKDFRAKFPAACLWYSRHKNDIGELPLQAQKKSNNFWTKENCMAVAKLFKYRSEFQNKQKGAYLKAMRKGWLNEICAHMVEMPFVAKGGSPGQSAANKIDILGQRFGRWQVIAVAPKRKGYRDLFWTCRCDCGTISDIRGQHLRKSTSTKCGKCSTQVSAPQRELYEFVKQYAPDAILSDRSIGRELDIYVPSKSFAIEYDGLLFHSEYTNRPELIRVSAAVERKRFNSIKAAGVSCFRIFSDEYKRNPDLIRAMILMRLGHRPVLKAQNIEFKLIENPVTHRQFFETNHIDGYGASLLGYGAFDGDKLIACMTFRKYTKGKYKGQLELSRFCSDYKYDTYGYFSKLLKLAKSYAKQAGYAHIVSASDNRLSSGKVYANNGFKEVAGSDYRLNYYYYLHSKGRRMHRFQCRKIKPPKITQAEYLQYPTERLQTSSGFLASKKFGKWEPLYRIYGWGNKLWVLTLK